MTTDTIIQLLRDLRVLTGINRFDIAERLLTRTVECQGLLDLHERLPSEEFRMLSDLIDLNWQGAHKFPNGRVAQDVIIQLLSRKQAFEQRQAIFSELD